MLCSPLETKEVAQLYFVNYFINWFEPDLGHLLVFELSSLPAISRTVFQRREDFQHVYSTSKEEIKVRTIKNEA